MNESVVACVFFLDLFLIIYIMDELIYVIRMHKYLQLQPKDMIKNQKVHNQKI